PGNYGDHAQAREGNVGGVKGQAGFGRGCNVASKTTPPSYPQTPTAPNTRVQSPVTAARSAATSSGSTRAFSIPSSLIRCCNFRYRRYAAPTVPASSALIKPNFDASNSNEMF